MRTNEQTLLGTDPKKDVEKIVRSDHLFLDKLGEPVTVGDFVLTASNGSRLNFALVWRVQSRPRPMLETIEARQENDDPASPIRVSLQSVASRHQVALIPGIRVPIDVRNVLEQALEHANRAMPSFFIASPSANGTNE